MMATSVGMRARVVKYAAMTTAIAPIVAASGVAGAYRSRNEPFAELVDTTPTAPRVLLRVRLTLVLGYDLALALAASAVLAVTAADRDGAAGLAVLVAACAAPTTASAALRGADGTPRVALPGDAAAAGVQADPAGWIVGAQPGRAAQRDQEDVRARHVSTALRPPSGRGCG